MTRVERWPKLLHGPIELSDCVVRGRVDRDRVVLAAKLTAGERSVGVEVVVNDREVDVIELHPEPEDLFAVRRNGFEVSQAPLTPEEFRSQVEAALIVRADSDRWYEDHSPGMVEMSLKFRPDLPARAGQLRRWLGLPDYEPVPRSAVADPLPVVLPPHGPATGMWIAVAVEEPEPAIWRRLEVRSDITLAALHRILAAAFERDERQEHRFETAYGGFSADVRHWDGDRLDEEVTLGQVVSAPGHRLIYNAGDWEHWLRVEKLVDLPRTASCLGGKRAAPPAECEDARGYELLMAALRGQYDEDDEDLIEELGPGFDPEWFDREVVNERLARLS
ncbi:plasmid pRiA4b ORF-3 family protein [Amycolatopsis sp. NPDC057786]|uniref:plasmid pRiA4b ORF-3 family protein n=1 Tax=Amycolatopsis sp. NPDC057786 TaxID=3346250 RepID=UPI00366D61AE